MVNDTKSCSVALESSIMLLELSSMLQENIYSIGITHDEHHSWWASFMIIIFLQYRQAIDFNLLKNFVRIESYL